MLTMLLAKKKKKCFQSKFIHKNNKDDQHVVHETKG